MPAGTVEKPKPTRRGAAESLAAHRASKEPDAVKDPGKAGRAELDAEHAAAGTPADTVPGVPGPLAAQSDSGPQDIHGSDEDDEMAQSASGAPVQLGFTVGGKKPTAAQVRLVGGKVDVPGNYRKGQVVAFRVEVKFGEIAFVDLEDKETGQVVGCDRRQKGRIVGITEVD